MPGRGIPKWRDEHYVTVYELACAGMSKLRISQMMGIEYRTLKIWLRKRPAFKDAYERGCKRRGTMATFKQYLYGRLSKKLRRVWKKIVRLDKGESGIETVRAVMKNQGRLARQHLWLHAYFSRNFNKTEACRLTGIDYNTVDHWIHFHPEFHELFDGMMEAKGDFFESSLIGKVKEGDTNAILFVNKTFNANRGYGPKLQIEHSGEVKQRVEVVPVKDLNLELELKKALLVAIRERNEVIGRLEHKSNGSSKDHANGSR